MAVVVAAVAVGAVAVAVALAVSVAAVIGGLWLALCGWRALAVAVGPWLRLWL